MSRKILTKARKRFISSLTKNLIIVVVAGAFGGEYIFRLSGVMRLWFVAAVFAAALTLFTVGVWLAVDETGES